MNLQELLQDVGYKCRSYSGRNMYGNNCLGVTLSSRIEPMRFVAEVLEHVADHDGDDMADMLDELVRGLRDCKTDSMGRGMIIYFPMIDFEGEEDDDEEDED